MDPHDLASFPTAPSWALALGGAGKVAVIVTLVASILTLALSFFDFVKVRRIVFTVACLGMIVAFVSLATLFVTDQYSFDYVFRHSAKDNPLSYKFASVWTAQEGSFLLWAVLSAVIALLSFRKTEVYEKVYTATFAVLIGVLSAILAKESPFNIPKEAYDGTRVLLPPDGGGMVPGLQNYWVIIHPPVIFLGFALLGLPFAYAISALVTRNYDRWAALARGPVLFGVSVLGLGISLGGLWAYETQGWGGFWAWDPVENVSLVPWLFLVVLAHGLIVQTVKKQWHFANLLMAGLPFIAFVYGTFLTRSGLLDKVSVHSFASMDKTALMILRWFLIVVVAGFAALLVARRPQRPMTWVNQVDDMTTPYPRPQLVQPTKADESSESGYNRTSFYTLGAMSLSLMAAVIALGMSWPVISAMRDPLGQGSAVEAGVYHRAVVWFFAATMLAMAIAPFASWKKEKLTTILGRFTTIASAAVGLVGAFLILAKNPSYGVGIAPGPMADGPFKGTQIRLEILVAFLLFLCAFVLLANLWRAIELAGRSKMGVGSFIAHLGMAILLGGLIISKSLEREEKAFVREGSPGAALGYTIAFKDYDPSRYYDRNNFVKFSVTNPAGVAHDITPTLYYYPSGDGEAAQVWPYIERTLSHDMYFFMGQPTVDVWEMPMKIKPGETQEANGIKVTYLEMTRKGEAGTVGVEFGAKLKIEFDKKTYEVHPTLTMTDQGLEPSLPQVGVDYRIAMAGMDAADKSVTLQLYLSPPLYQIQVFYKPLTCLVWIGTGIFTIGGLMSAMYRRSRSKAPGGAESEKTATIDNVNDAAIATS